jgi:hypothetical protein
MNSGSLLFFDTNNLALQLTNIQQLDKGVLALSYKPVTK